MVSINRIVYYLQIRKSDEGKERMMSMTETNDGFVLAEKDLEFRGPGDFFGKTKWFA